MPLKVSMYPFSQGLPGSMKRVVTPTRASHCRTAVAVSSGPLSERRYAGVPRATKSAVSWLILRKLGWGRPHAADFVRVTS